MRRGGVRGREVRGRAERGGRREARRKKHGVAGQRSSLPPTPQELIDMMNSNSALRTEVDRLELELKSQLLSHKQQMETVESSLNALFKQKASDETAIGGLVSTIQELRSEKEEGSARVTSLTRDLEDSGRELTAAVSRNDVLVSGKMLIHNTYLLVMEIWLDNLQLAMPKYYVQTPDNVLTLIVRESWLLM